MAGALLYPAVVGAIATKLTDSLTANGRLTSPARGFVRMHPEAPRQLAQQITTFTSLGQEVRQTDRRYIAYAYYSFT